MMILTTNASLNAASAAGFCTPFGGVAPASAVRCGRVT